MCTGLNLRFRVRSCVRKITMANILTTQSFRCARTVVRFWGVNTTDVLRSAGASEKCLEIHCVLAECWRKSYYVDSTEVRPKFVFVFFFDAENDDCLFRSFSFSAESGFALSIYFSFSVEILYSYSRHELYEMSFCFRFRCRPKIRTSFRFCVGFGSKMNLIFGDVFVFGRKR